MSFGRSPFGRSFFGYGYGYGELMSFLPFIIVGVVLLIIISVVVKGRNRGGILILKDFFFNEVEYEFLKIIGRPSGFISWLKSLFGKDSITSFVCNKQEVKLESAGFKYNIPLRHVTCVATGMNKPIFLLILGIVFIIAGIACASIHFSIVLVGIILGVVFIILYALNKNMQFSIFTGENSPIISIRVKGQGIDFGKFISASNALNKTVLEIGTPIKVIK